jgi:ribosomal protein L28
MSRLCELCGRGANRANWRSHSNIASKRRQFVNLQVKRIAGVKTKACARCLRSLTKSAKKA